jgi:hypothetical protein
MAEPRSKGMMSRNQEVTRERHLLCAHAVGRPAAHDAALPDSGTGMWRLSSGPGLLLRVYVRRRHPARVVSASRHHRSKRAARAGADHELGENSGGAGAAYL